MLKKTTKSSNIISRKRTRLFFTGFSMGLADLIPGVSGGTIAFLFGIYDELLYSIRLLTGKVPKLLIAGKIQQAIKLVPLGFLLPLAIGISTAIFGLVNVVSFLIDSQPVFVWSLFFGLVLGSAYIVSRRITRWKLSYVLLLIVGFALTFIVVGLPSIGGSDSPLAVFMTGAIAITAMILPGISGSLIMVLLGQYEIIIKAVSNRNILLLFIFAAGAVTGLALFVRLLTWLLKHYHLSVIAVLIGVMAGSLRRIWPWQTTNPNDTVSNILPNYDWALILSVLLIVAGFVVVFVLEKLGIAREHDDINTREFKKELHEIEGS